MFRFETGAKLIPILANAQGQYFFPNMPCGILPFYIDKRNTIIWGCVETNRVGVLVVAPPGGTQDIIAIRGETRLVIELAKPFPPSDLSYLSKFVGIPVKDDNYQAIINCLITNGFSVYAESPYETAVHETREEHGADLQEGKGINPACLNDLFEFAPQTIPAKRGTTTQKIYAAYVTSPDTINLKYTDKVEQKILMNSGKKFYEKGVWGSLDNFKLILIQERNKINSAKDANLTEPQRNLMDLELKAFASRLELLEKIEMTVYTSLSRSGVIIHTHAQLQALPYSLFTKNDFSTVLRAGLYRASEKNSNIETPERAERLQKKAV